MFTSKSFDLTAEETKKKKKREQLYQPKRMRWMKYIAIPALVGFMLMLILCNIDFSYDVEVKYTTSEQTNDFSTTTSEIMTQESTQEPEAAKAQSMDCAILQCSVYCNGTLDNFGEQLDSQTHNCTNCFAVHLQHCYFEGGSLKSDFLKVNFNLCSLTIFDCNLRQIEKNAFQHESVKNMPSLFLSYNNLIELHSETFEGLKNLHNFTLINQNSVSGEFVGVNFLQPFIMTLLHVKIVLTTHVKSSSVYKLSDWFGQSVFPVLTSLDLADNSFADIMNLSIFNNMPMLRNLNLANCSVGMLMAATTVKTWPMLQQLDLSSNHLTILSDDFIEAAVEHDIHLELSGNNWNCSCANVKMMQYIKTKQFREMPKCASPEEFLAQPMNEIELECLEYEENLMKTLMMRADNDDQTTKTDLSTSTLYTGPTASMRSTTTSTTATTTEVTTTIKEPEVAEFNHIFKCAHLTDEYNINELKFYYNAVMRITDMSSSSVHIILYGNISDNWQMYYMLEGYTKAASYSLNLRQYSFVAIEDLLCKQSYLFCLMFDDALMTSPLNCRAHRLPACEYSWFEMHETLILSVGVLGIILCTLLGVFSMFFLLRCRPTWVKGSKRLVRATKGSRQMLLFPKKKVKFVIDDTKYELSPETNYQDGNYQEISSRKCANNAQMSPFEFAPPTPASSSRSSQPTEPNLTYEELI